jgi:hypothetical protein
VSAPKTQMIAIGDEDNIYAYEIENGQVANYREATDEEKAEFQAAEAAKAKK